MKGTVEWFNSRLPLRTRWGLLLGAVSLGLAAAAAFYPAPPPRSGAGVHAPRAAKARPPAKKPRPRRR